MRLIEFKAKRHYDHEWVTGNLLYSDDNKRPLIKVHHDTTSALFEVDKDTICQSTGARDRYDLAIFEGDIGLNSIGAFFVRWDEDTCKFVMEYFTGECDVLDFNFLSGNEVIIGNVHDNPEWLQVKE